MAFNAQTYDSRQFGRVAVLMGGSAAERDVSLMSGAAVLDALLAAGVDAFALDIDGENTSGSIIDQLQAVEMDRAFNILHGGAGENGTLSAILESMAIPYTGCAMAASALAMDKVVSKCVWQGLGMPTARFEVLEAESNWQLVVERLGLPVMVKPVRDGSSIGMNKAETVEELADAYREAAAIDPFVMAEAWLSGAEFTVGIVGEQTLPSIRLETERDFYDYQAKYIDDDTRYFIPSGLADEAELALQQLALRAYHALGCRGWGRVDLMQDEKGDMQLLEINTTPGMTSHSLVPKAAAAAGLGFQQLVLEILAGATGSEHQPWR